MASTHLNSNIPAFPRLHAIPSLSSEEDFEVWHNALLLQLSYFDVHDIITGDEQAPAKTAPQEVQKCFKRKQVLAYTMLSNSIQPIITKLQALGYNEGNHALDPRSLYKAVIKWDSEISAEHKFRLVKELTDIDHSQFPNLHAFLGRALWLRRRLNRALFDVSDELMDMLLLKGISSYDDALTKMILHSKTTGSAVEDIASLIAKKATEQEAMSVTSKTITCPKATLNKGTQATCTKASQENSTQTEAIPNQTYKQTSHNDAPRPDALNARVPSAVDHNSKNIKPSNLTTTPNGVLQGTTKVGRDSQDMTIDETHNNVNAPTNADATNGTPQSEVNFGRKSPNTNLTTPSPTPNGAWQGENVVANLTAAHNTNSGVTKPSNPQTSGPVTNTGRQTDGNSLQRDGFGLTSNGSSQNGPRSLHPSNAVPGRILNRQKQVHDWLLGNSWTNAENPPVQSDQKSPPQRAASVLQQQQQQPPQSDHDPFGPESFASYLYARDIANAWTKDGKLRAKIKKGQFGPEDPRHW
ncbi:hypothetical protein NEUTE1DRAFT_36306 [Neurospora tetrasperma FGSC 2508]|uniref:Uncharacterized protein n=1 Tax=Neurospora tetrasperma (strain FGSC 2508 / ATCC MYA-4615 / P0657) TaxID=510951 RepID=F8MCV9_NEUT8|nr:uncharacterized protein NEUTE1DRAFT_36306 [Neurospora tetrasperma FGSC 2508]EGO61357.1 hypothetical protein NEUTE1DRAFT_36306 [Neurospora tetrasperma FGSC 2508]EGZ74620.1 hypothetical protein NEUTE2DRAFT_125581 [Neurospora tetrasperma FGSC 2509]